jgi:alpha-glucosidase
VNVFEYYEDDGSTIDHEKGKYYKRKITFDPQAKQMVFSKNEGSYRSKFIYIKCFFHGFEQMENLQAGDGIEMPVAKDDGKLLDGLEYLEDIYDPVYYKSLRLEEKRKSQQMVTILNGSEEMRISWN